jgi:hypothetical protein
MAAHFAIDVVLLYKLSTDKAFEFRPPTPPEFFFSETPTDPDSTTE